MSHEGDYIERTTVTPDGRETVRETTPTVVRSSNAGWWIAAVIAAVAVIGLVFLFASQNQQDRLQAAHDQGVAEARLDTAAVQAQRSAMEANQAAQTAMDSTARATRRAAETAQSAADQTAQAAQSAGDAARDASTTEPAPAQQ